MKSQTFFSNSRFPFGLLTKYHFLKRGTMPQIINKPIEQMTIEELKQERQVHAWQAQKSERGAQALQKRLYWLEQNEPIKSRDEIRQDYEEGRLSEAQYKTAFARRATAINYRKRAERQAEYSLRVAKEERALLFQIDERMLQLEVNAPRPKRGRPPKRDPRKRETVKKKTYKRPPNLMTLQKRWYLIQQSNRSNTKSAPIPYWNTDTLKKLAYDRGYFTTEGFIADVAQELQLSYTATKKLLTTGGFTFGQALTLGAFLEMTPREFCDTFLYNYFRDSFGNYVATVDDKQTLLNKPIKTPSN